MPSAEILDKIKRATVALAMLPQSPPKESSLPPFNIIGSGFCIDPDGIIITCEHVISAFLNRDIRQVISEIPESDRKGRMWPLRDIQLRQPHALFFDTKSSAKKLQVIPAPANTCMAKIEYDMGVIRVSHHLIFSNGYHYLDIEDFANIFEGMEVAACGFPLGNDLQMKTGALTSSFTRGIISSIIPSPNLNEDLVKAFQLDITATNGNSGGPVFSWDSGKVIGIIQSAPTDVTGRPISGFIRAESIYRILRDGTIDNIRNTPLL